MEVVEDQVYVLLLVTLVEARSWECLDGLGSILRASVSDNHLVFLVACAFNSRSFSNFAVLHEELDGILFKVFQ